ncbi:hypothetical protein [Amycolatopsis sp. ATCC 39116]|uniref:hypothetical protein n=1 Tax=Amycolatopsis sp. (strain ATCC 39116 / 75iv2) TaxID=385957 RepID=UPI000262596B|nr:hypothetical protein [Amycolatopsis sp. ATCC 39116]
MSDSASTVSAEARKWSYHSLIVEHRACASCGTEPGGPLQCAAHHPLPTCRVSKRPYSDSDRPDARVFSSALPARSIQPPSCSASAAGSRPALPFTLPTS